MTRKKYSLMKYCPKCDKIQPIINFCSNKSKKSGIAGYCKSCMSGMQKLRLDRKKELRHIKAAKDPMFMIKFKIDRSFRTFKKRLKPGYMGCITPAEEVLPFWDGECNSCGRKISLITKSVKEKNSGAFLDHDHKTGHFRGFLCSWCNFVIGHAKDDVEILKKCVAFLERHKQRHPPTKAGVLGDHKKMILRT